MFYPGARVVAHGLKSRSDLNDSCGIVVSRRQRGRWALQFGCNGQALSVAGKNLALSTTQAEKASCVIARRDQSVACRICGGWGLVHTGDGPAER